MRAKERLSLVDGDDENANSDDNADCKIGSNKESPTPPRTKRKRERKREKEKERGVCANSFSRNVLTVYKTTFVLILIRRKNCTLI